MRRKRVDHPRPRRLPQNLSPADGPNPGGNGAELTGADRPLGHRTGGGSAGFGQTIAGIMHGIDADIFRDPAAVQRMEKQQPAGVKTAGGTIVGIEVPPEEAAADEPAGGGRRTG